MSRNKLFTFKSAADFAGFGENTLAYVRRVDDDTAKMIAVDDLEQQRAFEEGAPEGWANHSLWGLYSAAGEAIAISDDREVLVLNALENDLVPMNIH